MLASITSVIRNGKGEMSSVSASRKPIGTTSRTTVRFGRKAESRAVTAPR
jgi:hypothetical protein